MAQITHSIHKFIIILIKYLMMISIIGFMPIPLLSYFGGDVLHQPDHTPLFNYFDEYHIKINDILENKYTNVYLNKDKNLIESYEIDNAVFWTEYVSHQLNEMHVPVVRKIISLPLSAEKT